MKFSLLLSIVLVAVHLNSVNGDFLKSLINAIQDMHNIWNNDAHDDENDFQGGGEYMDYGMMGSGGPPGIQFFNHSCPAAIDSDTEPTCNLRSFHNGRNTTNETSGAWVCRTLYDIVTGEQDKFSACVDLDHFIETDVCGCCNDVCPSVDPCPCGCDLSMMMDDFDDSMGMGGGDGRGHRVLMGMGMGGHHGSGGHGHHGSSGHGHHSSKGYGNHSSMGYGNHSSMGYGNHSRHYVRRVQMGMGGNGGMGGGNGGMGMGGGHGGMGVGGNGGFGYGGNGNHSNETTGVLVQYEGETEPRCVPSSMSFQIINGPGFYGSRPVCVEQCN